MDVTVSKFQPDRWKIMKKNNASSHLYCPTSAVVGAPATDPAGGPGSGAGVCYPDGFSFQGFGTRMVRIAKFCYLGGRAPRLTRITLGSRIADPSQIRAPNIILADGSRIN